MRGDLWLWVWGLAVLGGGLWASVRLGPAVWRGEHRERLHDTFAPMGTRLGRSFESLVPCAFGGCAYVGLMLVALQLAGPADGETNGLSIVLSVGLLLVVAATFGILLLDRPKVLVPPHLRDGHSGLLGGLFSRRAGRGG